MLRIKFGTLLVLYFLVVAQGDAYKSSHPQSAQKSCGKATDDLFEEFEERTRNLQEQLEWLSPTLKEVVWKILEIEYNVKELKEQLDKYREKMNPPETPVTSPNYNMTLPGSGQGSCSFNLSEMITQFLRENMVNGIIFVNGSTTINAYNSTGGTGDHDSNYPLITSCAQATATGLYTLSLANGVNITVGCDCEYQSVMQSPSQGGCWLLAQRRVPVDKITFALQEWDAYKNGFGDPTGDYWLGLDHMYQVMLSGPEVHFVLNNTDEYLTNTYASLSIGDESQNYSIIRVGGSYTDEIKMDLSVTAPFSTSDRSSINWTGGNAARVMGGGFWYNVPPQPNINGFLKTMDKETRMYIKY